eukprot:191901-Pelagomonas_calceolata.AAC.1
MDLCLAGRYQPQADHPNDLTEGHPPICFRSAALVSGYNDVTLPYKEAEGQRQRASRCYKYIQGGTHQRQLQNFPWISKKHMKSEVFLARQKRKNTRVLQP